MHSQVESCELIACVRAAGVSRRLDDAGAIISVREETSFFPARGDAALDKSLLAREQLQWISNAKPLDF